jgi:hypothetical protein
MYKNFFIKKKKIYKIKKMIVLKFKILLNTFFNSKINLLEKNI